MNMTKRDAATGVICCFNSCRRDCPLYPLKIGEDGTLNFLCLSHHTPTHKAAEDAIEKVVRENPKAFPEDVIRAIIKQARLV